MSAAIRSSCTGAERCLWAVTLATDTRDGWLGDTIGPSGFRTPSAVTTAEDEAVRRGILELGIKGVPASGVVVLLLRIERCREQYPLRCDSFIQSPFEHSFLHCLPKHKIKKKFQSNTKCITH